MQLIAIIDYGMGNLKSVSKAIETVGGKVTITSNPDSILNADKVILPGVGAFRDCIHNLKKFNLVEPVKEFIKSGKYFLGICLGMHMLFDISYEFGEYKGLGIIKGSVKKFENIGNLPIPHMGWNVVEKKKSSNLLHNIKNKDFFYFAHSFYVSPDNSSDILTTTDYGFNFTSSINRENIFGVQFHPEKSQKNGLQVLKNFMEL